jgi:imidazolonepropionase-like amidohydrolase
VGRGADVIKVCVSGWLADARRDPKRYEISDEELAAAIEEAHRLKRRVAVHAISAGGIAAAVRLGADLVAHGGFVDAETLAAIRRRRVYVLPTLFSFVGAQPAADVDSLQAHLRDSVRAGLPVAFGTDAGVIAHGQNAREFALLRDLGLSPIEVIRIATIHAAAAIGLEDRVGALAPGLSADVIGVPGNPLVDLAVLQRVMFVRDKGDGIKRP